MERKHNTQVKRRSKRRREARIFQIRRAGDHGGEMAHAGE